MEIPSALLYERRTILAKEAQKGYAVRKAMQVCKSVILLLKLALLSTWRNN